MEWIRKILIIYFIVVNSVTFILWGIDKYKAKKHQWRIKEKTLLRWIRLGGGFGALLGIGFFRHKTIKGSFLWKVYLICIVWLVVFILFLYFN